jgi:hypothetical protein
MSKLLWSKQLFCKYFNLVFKSREMWNKSISFKVSVCTCEELSLGLVKALGCKEVKWGSFERSRWL